jgi:hypothetical protein
VQYALYALAVRGVFSVLSALSLRGARGEVRTQLADGNKTKGWDNAQLDHNVDLVLRASLLNAGVMILLLALIAKFVWDGKPWARWVYLAAIVLLARDQNAVIGFFAYHHLLVRLTTGLLGVAGLVSLVLLFVPASNAYFRPLNRPAGGGLFGALMPKARAGVPVAEPGTARPGRGGRPVQAAASPTTPSFTTTSAADPSDVESRAPERAAPNRPNGPRGKSRQAPPKPPPGRSR